MTDEKDPPEDPSLPPQPKPLSHYFPDADPYAYQGKYLGDAFPVRPPHQHDLDAEQHRNRLKRVLLIEGLILQLQLQLVPEFVLRDVQDYVRQLAATLERKP